MHFSLSFSPRNLSFWFVERRTLRQGKWPTLNLGWRGSTPWTFLHRNVPETGAKPGSRRPPPSCLPFSRGDRCRSTAEKGPKLKMKQGQKFYSSSFALAMFRTAPACLCLPAPSCPNSQPSLARPIGPRLLPKRGEREKKLSTGRKSGLWRGESLSLSPSWTSHWTH